MQARRSYRDALEEVQRFTAAKHRLQVGPLSLPPPFIFRLSPWL